MSDRLEGANRHEIIREMLNVGLWTMGLVATASATYLAYHDQGLSWITVCPVLMVVALGVAGYLSVQSIERLAEVVRNRA